MFSCVPVNYNTKVFHRSKSNPRYVGEVAVGVHVDAASNNAFNSRSRGGWKILVSFVSKSKHEVKLARLVVKRGSSVLMDSRIAENLPLIEHPEGGQWANTYQYRDMLHFESNEGEMIQVEAFISVDGASEVKVSSKFKVSKISGLKWVNVLTM